MSVKQIDGPKTPALIQKLNWIADPLGYMDICSRKCGDIFATGIAVGEQNLVFVSHPEAIQYILTHDTKELTSHFPG